MAFRRDKRRILSPKTRLQKDLSRFETLERRLLLAREAHWIEGEASVSSTFVESFGAGPWYNSTNIDKTLLSPGVAGQTPGNWRTHYAGATSSGVATYRFNVANPGNFNYWIRLNPFFNNNGGNQYSVRVNGGSWSNLDTSDVSSVTDLVDPGIDIRFIGWKFASFLTLPAGQNEIQIRISNIRTGAITEVHGGVDVMALTNYPWVPQGTIAPDPNAPPPGPEAWFPLTAGPDSFSSESIIDLSGMLEDNAGSRGRITRELDQFVDAAGQPIKFWGINAAPASTSQAVIEQQARFYAKHGINIVRQHPVQDLLGELTGPRSNRQLDPARVDLLDRWFATLKQNGIYMTWSIFYNHVIKPDERVSQGGTVPDALYNELPNRGSGKDAYGMASFVDEYQDSQWTYANLLLNHVNPYTGLAYKNDPALVSVEMRNEDSIFFDNPITLLWNNRSGANLQHANRLRSMFGSWVKAKYATEAALTAAWGTARQPVDHWNAGLFEIMGAFHMGTNGPLFEYTGQLQRMRDWTQFIAEMQRADYQQYHSRLRGIGFDGVIVSTAWKAGGPSGAAANLWTDDAMDAIDRHNYFGGGAGGHGITTGTVNNDTHMQKPGRGLLSTGFWQVEDKPFVYSEWTQSPPNQWKAEASPLVAFYGMGLQGWDASYQFAGGRSYMGNGWPSLSSYVSETPHYMGQFPALAFAIYNGHFDEGEVISARRFDLTQGTNGIFRGTDILQQQFGLVGTDTAELLRQGSTTSEFLAIGRVVQKAGTDLPASQIGSTAPYWNTTTRIVNSNTGQLTWDYAKRVVLAKSDKTQGVIGFGGGSTWNLPGVDVSLSTNFVSLLFTALDNKPLIESENILITAMARDRQYGSTYNSTGTQLLTLGAEPLELEPVRANISIKGSAIDDVLVVDAYGVPTDQQVSRTGNSFTIDGRYATYYYQVKRTIDSVGPSVTASAFEFETRQAMTVTFSEDVGASLNASDLVLTNTTTGQAVAFSMSYDGATRTATVLPTESLATGRYALRVIAAGVADGAGNTMTGDHVLPFDFVVGDATRDGRTDFSDLLIVAQNYGSSGRTYSQGNFDYDTAGDVGFNDLLILAQNYGTQLIVESPTAKRGRSSRLVESVIA
jgi:hypothetical protein